MHEGRHAHVLAESAAYHGTRMLMQHDGALGLRKYPVWHPDEADETSFVYELKPVLYRHCTGTPVVPVPAELSGRARRIMC